MVYTYYRQKDKRNTETMTYNELRDALKSFRDAGKTDIKLSGKGITKDVLQAEYDRLTRTDDVKVAHTFSDMVSSRIIRKPAKGFTIEKVVCDEFEEMMQDFEIWERLTMIDEYLTDLESFCYERLVCA